jgi:uncharacterized coiled-coil protein SlyX
LADWEHELLQFPNGAHDDQVDTLSLAVYEVTLGALRSPIRNRRTEPATMQEKMDNLLNKLIKQKQKDRKNPSHPILGKM